jgi:hypothetical protein
LQVATPSQLFINLYIVARGNFANAKLLLIPMLSEIKMGRGSAFGTDSLASLGYYILL